MTTGGGAGKPTRGAKQVSEVAVNKGRQEGQWQGFKIEGRHQNGGGVLGVVQAAAASRAATDEVQN